MRSRGVGGGYSLREGKGSGGDGGWGGRYRLNEVYSIRCWNEGNSRAIYVLARSQLLITTGLAVPQSNSPPLPQPYAHDAVLLLGQSCRLLLAYIDNPALKVLTLSKSVSQLTSSRLQRALKALTLSKCVSELISTVECSGHYRLSLFQSVFQSSHGPSVAAGIKGSHSLNIVF